VISGDLKNTIYDILASANVKSNSNFLLYVTGYAIFFNLNDDWYNTHSFGVFSWPPLSHVLRSDINALVAKLNTAYQTTIQNYPTKNVRFVSIDTGFDGHRFCESGSTPYRQYFDSNVWF
jgi:hypothetical protein